MGPLTNLVLNLLSTEFPQANAFIIETPIKMRLVISNLIASSLNLRQKLDWQNSISILSTLKLETSIDLNYADSGLAFTSGILKAVGNPINSTSTIKEDHDIWSEELSLYSDNHEGFDWSVSLFANVSEITGNLQKGTIQCLHSPN